MERISSRPGRLAEALLYRVGNKLFHLLGRQCGAEGNDLDLVIGNIGYSINRQPGCAPGAPDY